MTDLNSQSTDRTKLDANAQGNRLLTFDQFRLTGATSGGNIVFTSTINLPIDTTYLVAKPEVLITLYSSLGVATIYPIPYNDNAGTLGTVSIQQGIKPLAYTLNIYFITPSGGLTYAEIYYALYSTPFTFVAA